MSYEQPSGQSADPSPGAPTAGPLPDPTAGYQERPYATAGSPYPGQPEATYPGQPGYPPLDQPAAYPPAGHPDPAHNLGAGQYQDPAQYPGAGQYPAPGQYPGAGQYLDPGPYAAKGQPVAYPAVGPVTGYPGYGYPGYGYPPAMSTNGMAVASMVVSIVSLLGLCFYGLGGYLGIVGAVLGHVARRQIRTSGEGGDGMALGGVIMGWIATAVAVLATIALVGFFAWAVNQDPSTFDSTTVD